MQVARCLTLMNSFIDPPMDGNMDGPTDKLKKIIERTFTFYFKLFHVPLARGLLPQ